MRQWAAFLKKECLEQMRTGRLLILIILFCLFGIMNPAIAKLTPWMMDLMADQLAENGLALSSITVDALTSWTQYFKNIPIILIVFIVMYSGTLTVEYQKGTLINVVTKGMKRRRILGSKLMVMIAGWTVGTLLMSGITYGYNAYFWDNHIVKNLLAAVLCYYLAGVWLITVILLASAAAKSASVVILAAGAAFGGSYLLGLFAQCREYVPTYLMRSGDLLAGLSDAGDYLPAVGIAVALMVVNVWAATVMFDRRELLLSS